MIRAGNKKVMHTYGITEAALGQCTLYLLAKIFYLVLKNYATNNTGTKKLMTTL